MSISVLLVDDNPPDNQITRIFLVRAGVAADDAIHCALDGIEALEWLDAQDQPPKLILVDINMPRMNGFEFVEALPSRVERWQQTPAVLMLSSSVADQDRSRAESLALVRGYLAKPMSRTKAHDLLQYVR